jgi:hypothetical protein
LTSDYGVSASPAGGRIALPNQALQWTRHTAPRR